MPSQPVEQGALPLYRAALEFDRPAEFARVGGRNRVLEAGMLAPFLLVGRRANVDRLSNGDAKERETGVKTTPALCPKALGYRTSD